MVKRSSGRSSVSAAAYRAAEKLRGESSSVHAAAYRSGEALQNDQSDMTHDYTRKRGVVHTEILLPDSAPEAYRNRATLWNAVEQAEKRKDAQTARDIDIALPVELSRQGQLALLRKFIKENFVDSGMCADFAIHDKKDGNPHAHILLTTREVSPAGFGRKNREWNQPSQLKRWREGWANCCNEFLKEFDKRIDHRTLQAQGIDREPTIHIGVTAKQMERRGEEHPRAKKNREIAARNTARRMHKLKENYIILDGEISALQREATQARREMNAFCRAAEEIHKRAEQISAMGQRMEALKASRQKRQLEQLERSYEQAASYFTLAYKCSPEQAAAEIQRTAATAESKQHLQEKLQEKITPLIEEREALLLDYQWQSLYAQLSPSRQEIYDYIAKLEKESRAHRQSVQENLARLRCQQTLDAITWKNFQEIIKQSPPEKAQALIERYEHEREQNRIRTFSRGREC
jgi:hypothetical protein